MSITFSRDSKVWLNRLIKLADIYFGYSEDFVIRACSASFKSPGMSIIMGPNCSGKSTLLDIISTFKVPSSGRLFINGVDPFGSGRALSAVRELLSYMPANLVLPPSMRVAEIIRECSGNKVNDGILRMLSINEYMDERYSELSDGMKTRVNLVISFCKAPFVLLDEPMRSQDDSLVKIFPKFISSFSAGKTIIMTTPIDIEGIENAERYELRAGRLEKHD
jgi:ABC-2 type transport system ATP-binding protein